MNEYDKMIQAINDYFSKGEDTQRETKIGLNSAIGEIEVLIDTLADD